MKTPERRAAGRESRRLPVSYRIKGQQARHTGFLRNISTSGVFIGTPRPLPRGTEIGVLVENDGVTLEIEAIVARKVWLPPDLRLLGSPGFGARLLTPPEAIAESTDPVHSCIRLGRTARHKFCLRQHVLRL